VFVFSSLPPFLAVSAASLGADTPQTPLRDGQAIAVPGIPPRPLLECAGLTLFRGHVSFVVISTAVFVAVRMQFSNRA